MEDNIGRRPSTSSGQGVLQPFDERAYGSSTVSKPEGGGGGGGNSLGAGAIIGIVIACIIGLALVVAAALFALPRLKSSMANSQVCDALRFERISRVNRSNSSEKLEMVSRQPQASKHKTFTDEDPSTFQADDVNL
jgi:hypothetical protein